MGSKVLVKSLTSSTARSGCDLQPACVAGMQTRRWFDLNFIIYLPSVTNEQERWKRQRSGGWWEPARAAWTQHTSVVMDGRWLPLRPFLYAEEHCEPWEIKLLLWKRFSLVRSSPPLLFIHVRSFLFQPLCRSTSIVPNPSYSISTCKQWLIWY